MKKLLRYFGIGALSVIPLFVAVQLVFWIQKFLTQYFQKVFEISNGNYGVMTISIALVFFSLVLIGYSIQKYGRFFFLTTVENIVQKIPIIKTVYNFTNDIVKLVSNSKGGEKVFSEVVLVPYPNEKLYSFGFITSYLNDTHYIVFVPTCPNPTSGFTVMAAKKDCFKVDLSIDEAMKAVVSIGAVIPTDKRESLLHTLQKTGCKSTEC
jgi:uncharacterized membrane protein